MKNVYLLLIGFFVALGVKAQNSIASLQIHSWDNTPFMVVLDGQKYQGESSVFNANQLRPGNHHLTILRRFNDYGSRGGSVRVIAQSSIFVDSFGLTRLRLTRENQLVVVQPQAPINNCNHMNNCGHWVNNNNNGWNNSGAYGCRNTNNYQGNYYNSGCGNVNNIAQLKVVLQQTAFDNDKLIVFKQAVANGYYNSYEIQELLGMFSFDANKLQAAKFAYSRVYDPQNYYVVNQVFTFSGSVRALDEYMTSRY